MFPRPNTLAPSPNTLPLLSDSPVLSKEYPFWQGISYATFALYWQQAQAPKDGDAVYGTGYYKPEAFEFWSGASDVETFMLREPGC